MTTLEIILLAIIWTGYGLFNNYRIKRGYGFHKYKGESIIYVIIAPISLIAGIIRGILWIR